MENSVNQRLSLLISGLKTSQRQFATHIGTSSQHINRICSGKNTPSSDLLERICSFYPQVSAEWLLRGEGSMFRNEGEIAREPEPFNGVPSPYRSMLMEYKKDKERLELLVDRLQQNIERLIVKFQAKSTATVHRAPYLVARLVALAFSPALFRV